MAELYYSRISLAELTFNLLFTDSFPGGLTDAEEDQGLHAEELLLSDLQRAEPLGEHLHPHTVFIHTGHLHPLAVMGEKKKQHERVRHKEERDSKRGSQAERDIERRKTINGGRGGKDEEAAEVRKNE